MNAKKPAYRELHFVSSNAEKHREYCALLGIRDLAFANVEVAEPQSSALEHLVRKKAALVESQLPRTPFFVEHSGLLIDGWNGLPGGLTRSFMELVGNDGICRMMKDYSGNERRARAMVVIGYVDPSDHFTAFSGETGGTIADAPRGSKNFGWDAIFVPDRGDGRTFAELTPEEKNAVSMRREAADKFLLRLRDDFSLTADGS